MCSFAQSQVTKDTPGWFEFIIPGLDATETPVDMSFLNPEAAGSKGFIRIEDDHFVDASGERLRFLGTNLTFSRAFPDKNIAQKLAAHMRKFGINIVRFHHMDNSAAPRGIWLKDKKGFDPEQLDKLDWIIYQFKQHGIYTNINLHVSRNYPGLPSDERAFRYGKVLDHFYRPFIEMQKEYARDLLTHKNPYTGNTYIQEPAVAFVEINNENTLIQNWQALMEMQEPFKSALLEQWNNHLKNKYNDTVALRKKWDVVNEPLGDELLINADFSDGSRHWELETGTTAEGRLEASENVLHVITEKPGEQSWNLQLKQNNLNLENGAPYTISFRAKSDAERNLAIGVRLQQSPWRFLGLQRHVQLSTEWQEFSFVFVASGTEPGISRLDFNFQNQMGSFWFTDMSLRRGGFIGLPKDQSIEERNMAVPETNAPENVRSDFWEFLLDVEMKYSEEMVKFLKDDLNVQVPISVTQASYGGIAGIYREAKLADYIDMHSYWQHPRFPNRPWSGTDWNIQNTSMVRDAQGGTLSRLALHAVKGMPFTVSEYDHPAPSDYSAEMFLMLSSFAAFQDWDGIYQFSYGGGDWDGRRISGYFSLNGHPGKLAFMPIAAAAYRMNGVSTGPTATVLCVPGKQVISQLTLHGTNARAAWEDAGASVSLPLNSPIAVEFSGDSISLSKKVEEMGEKWLSNTGQIAWDKTNSDTAIYTVNTPCVRAAVGYLGGQSIVLGDIEIKMLSTKTNWASIAIAALDGKSINESNRVLLVAAGRVENTNMQWNEDRTSVSNKWGTEPTVVEGIPAEITFGGKRQAQSLDGTGAPKDDVPGRTENNGTTFTIGAEYKTLWYLITKP